MRQPYDPGDYDEAVLDRLRTAAFVWFSDGDWNT